MAFFFFNDTATTEIYTLSLHDALPICFHAALSSVLHVSFEGGHPIGREGKQQAADLAEPGVVARSEEHTSELQSRQYLVRRLLLENKIKLRIAVRSASPAGAIANLRSH